MLSGFFGGFSGYQKTLRTAFRIRVGLPKEVFIGSIAVSIVVMDVLRLLKKITMRTIQITEGIVLSVALGTGLL